MKFRKENIFKQIQNCGNIPKLPQVLINLVRACDSGRSDIRDLTRIICADPGLVSTLLQIIDSTYVNLRHDVKTIHDAVACLGMDTIKNIAVSSLAKHYFKLEKTPAGFDINQFWLHSYKCGLFARQLAREFNLPNGEEFFLAGLLHDIGRLVLIQADPDIYDGLIDNDPDESRILSAEMDAFGVNSPRISAWFFRQWNMAPLMSGAVLFINEPPEKIQEELAQIKVIYLANVLAGPFGRDRISELSGFSDLPEGLLEEIISTVEIEAAQMAEHIELNPGAEHAGQSGVVDLEIKGKIRDYSLMYGTLENLLNARDLEAVKQVVQTGLKIIFNAGRVFFFFPDNSRNQIQGDCCRQDKLCNVVKSIKLPMSNKTSLLVNAFKQGVVKSSFTIRDRKIQAISDTQIIRLLDAQGMICIPVKPGDRTLCLIVAGISEAESERLQEDGHILELLSRQMGICMKNILFHQEYARKTANKKIEDYTAFTDRSVHEIKNPVFIINNYLESLQMKLPDRHPAQEELSGVAKEMSRICELLDEVSVPGKTGGGEFEFLDVNRFCSWILEYFKKSFIISKKIRIDLVPDPELPMIKTDSSALKQVLLNLLNNSAEAIEKAGRIELRTKFTADSPKTVTGDKQRATGSVKISITDNGPGISPEVLSRLFEPYNSGKKAKKQSGRGLAVVHAIIKELKGEIKCKTKQGAGTRFSVFLPVFSDQGRR